MRPTSVPMVTTAWPPLVSQSSRHSRRRPAAQRQRSLLWLAVCCLYSVQSNRHLQQQRSRALVSLTFHLQRPNLQNPLASSTCCRGVVATWDLPRGPHRGRRCKGHVSWSGPPPVTWGGPWPGVGCVPAPFPRWLVARLRGPSWPDPARDRASSARPLPRRIARPGQAAPPRRGWERPDAAPRRTCWPQGSPRRAGRWSCWRRFR